MLRNIQIMLENRRIFKNGSFPDMQSETVTNPSVPQVQRTSVYRIAEHMMATDTISCVLANSTSRCVALNFANAMFPGGAYLLGGNAQEEALCRASLLYYTIAAQKTYYRRNRLHVLPDYTDTLIISHHVPIIRDKDGTLLKTPVLCDFLTCPAVNRTFAKFLFTPKHCNAVMERRIAKIVQLAVAGNPETIVFGAFGCGVFGNKREIVYPLFEQAINRYVPDHIQVVFADPRAAAPLTHDTEREHT